MELDQNHIKNRERRRWPWLVLVGMILIVAGLRFSLMSATVQHYLKDKVTAIANEQLNVTLDIANIKGDLWKEITLYDITLTDREEPVASVDSLSLRYNILSYFSSEFEVTEISINRPWVNLSQKDDIWNVSTWIKETELEPTDESGGGSFPLTISSLNITGGTVDARVELLPQDSVFIVQNIQLSSRAAFSKDDFEVGISDFSFDIEGTPVAGPISVQSEAQLSGAFFSLEKLVLATGQSLLETSGSFSPADSSTRINLQTQPFSWQDITAFDDDLPLREDLDIMLNLSGNLSAFTVGLNLESSSLRNVRSDITIARDSVFALRDMNIEADRLDVASFLSDSSLPAVNNFKLSASGNMPVNEPKIGSLQGNIAMGQITAPPYRMDTFSANFGFQDESLSMTVQGQYQQQQLQIAGSVQDLFEEIPYVEMNVQGKGIDPAYWMQDSTYSGELAFSGSVSGRGFYPGDFPWNYNLTFTKGEISDQQFTEAIFRGNVSRSAISGKSTIQLNKSRLTATADVKNLQFIPEFTYNLELDNLDVSELNGMDEFTTSISGILEGQGRGNSLENLFLNSTVRIDSSLVNRELIHRMEADISIEDTVATVEKASLGSAIADGSFDARLHLTDLYRLSNNVNLNAKIKDLQALAPLTGADILQAAGSVTGSLRPLDNSGLGFSGEIELADVNYDSLLLASKAQGSVDVMVKENPEYLIDVSLETPSFSAVSLQDFNLKTDGRVDTAKTEGTFSLTFSSSEQGHINHAGSYSVMEDSVTVTTSELDFMSSLRTLSLEQPFTLSLKNGVASMDTLRMASDDGALLALAIPHADSLQQRGYLNGENLNLNILQETLLGEAYVGGLLSGELHLDRTDTLLSARGNLRITNMNYQKAVLDTLLINADINDEIMNAELKIFDQGDEIISGAATLPFKLGDPATFDSTFFAHPVKGSLQINEVALSRFEETLADAGISGTQGIISFNGELYGEAGAPDFTGRMSMREATLSGVAVDSVTASMNYDHQQSELGFTATVNSLKQKAADISANIPFSVDFKTFEVILPGEEDRIDINVTTNNFDLAAFNDFVDRRQLREIRGRLDGNVLISGPAGDLKTDGELQLSNGSMRIIPAGIRLQNIESTVGFEPDRITLKRIQVESGNGNLNASGNIAFEQLTPGNINLTVSANNFQVANTSEYNASINTRSKVGGTFVSPEITGQLQFVSGFVELRNFGEQSVENVQLDSEETQQESTALYDSLSLNMDVNFNRRFFIRNQRYLEMEVELEGQVDLLKEKEDDLQAFGSMNAASGYALPLGKRFEIEEGAITFSGNPANPQVNVRSLYEPRQPEEEIKIWYIIEGTVENPKFSYQSSPEMELENIISYTLFGQPFYKLDSWQQVVTSSGSNTTATDVALEVLMDRLESLATRKLGIDVVRIDNTRSAGENGTSITTGWYINPRVFFAIQNIITGSTPDTGFLLEYMLKRNLKLIISQGNDSRQGVDLKWNYDY